MSIEISQLSELIKVVIHNQIELSKQIKIVNDNLRAYNSSTGGAIKDIDTDRIRNHDGYDYDCML